MFKCNYSGLVRLRDAIAGTGAEELMQKCAKELAEKLVEAAKGRTPVETGRLAGGYEVTELSVSGGAVRAEVINQVEYAEYVELGHRTPSHTGWVPGRYMLTMAVAEIHAMAPEIVESKILEFLKGCISGGK